MEALDRRLEPVRLHVGVDLGRRDIGVPEHLLDRSQIGAAGEEMAGKGMPQHMRRDPPVVEPCFWICSPTSLRPSSWLGFCVCSS